MIFVFNFRYCSRLLFQVKSLFFTLLIRSRTSVTNYSFEPENDFFLYVILNFVYTRDTGITFESRKSLSVTLLPIYVNSRSSLCQSKIVCNCEHDLSGILRLTGEDAFRRGSPRNTCFVETEYGTHDTLLFGTIASTVTKQVPYYEFGVFPIYPARTPSC